MSETTPVHQLHPETTTEDALTTLIREGAREILAVALQAEVEEHVDRFRYVVDAEGERRVVRNGYLPEREIQTGAGKLAIKQPRIRVKGGEPGEEELRFESKLIPPYLRKAKSVEELISWLYLRGISTNDMEDALSGLLGVDAVGLSPSSIVRCKKVWEQEFEAWDKRSLQGKRYVYIWADGVYFNVRLTGERACILVVIGATADGRKEVLAIHDGMRESELSWTEVLEGLKARGLQGPPMLAIGDGALGFWKAISKVWPETRHQRCWSHKMANVLNKLPKSAHAHAKKLLQAIWMAETKANAMKAFDVFVSTYEAKFPKAVACLTKDSRVSDERQGADGRLLRLSGGTLAPSQDQQPDRIDLRHRSSEDEQDEGLRLAERDARHGLQAGTQRREEVATPQRARATGPPHRGRSVQRRNQLRSQGRRRGCMIKEVLKHNF